MGEERRKMIKRTGKASNLMRRMGVFIPFWKKEQSEFVVIRYLGTFAE